MSECTNSKSRGFTIVELLIVIVVIAILAAISIIAFNGIQDRARNTTAQETAAQLRQKIESFNAIKGNYPVPATATVAGLVTSLAVEKESKIDTELQALMVDGTLAATVTAEDPIKYVPCATAINGGTVFYWQKPVTPAVVSSYTLGTC